MSGKNSCKTLVKLVRLEICPWQLQIWLRPDAVGLLRIFCPNFYPIFGLPFELNRSSESRKQDRLRCRWWFRPKRRWDGERSRKLWKIREKTFIRKATSLKNMIDIFYSEISTVIVRTNWFLLSNWQSRNSLSVKYLIYTVGSAIFFK